MTISLTAESTGVQTLFRIYSHPNDLGKVIGKQGRTARAIRVIIAANGMRLKRSFAIDIVEQVVDGA